MLSFFRKLKIKRNVTPLQFALMAGAVILGELDTVAVMVGINGLI